MIYGETCLKETDDVEQKTVISKIHNMQWLKSNSQLFGHGKAFSDGKEIESQSVKDNPKEITDESIKILSSASLTGNQTVDQSISTLVKDNIKERNCVTDRDTVVYETVSDLSSNNMETVWDKDIKVPNALFSDTQSLVLQSLDEEEMMSMALAESIVSAQLEKYRIDENSETNLETSGDHSTTDAWNKAQSNSNIKNGICHQEIPKQCHDSNNNNAKSEIMSDINTNMHKIASKLDTEDRSVTCWAEEQADTSISTDTSNNSKSIIDSESNQNINLKSEVDSTSSHAIEPSEYSNKHEKEQDSIKKQIPLSSITNNKNSSVASTSNENSKFNAGRTNSSRVEGGIKNSEVDNSRRCHKVQVNRTQSYNYQYIRNKTSAKPQARYTRTITKSDQDLSRKPSEGGPSNHSGSFNASDNRPKYSSNRVSSSRDGYNRKYDQTDDFRRREREQNLGNNRNASGSSITTPAPMRSAQRSFEAVNQNRFERGAPNNGNQNSHKQSSGRASLSNGRNSNDKFEREGMGNVQKMKKDFNVYRRSSEYTSSRYLNTKPKVEDQRRNNVTNNIKDNSVDNSEPQLKSEKEIHPITNATVCVQYAKVSPQVAPNTSSQKGQEQIQDSFNSLTISGGPSTPPNINTYREDNNNINKINTIDQKNVKFSDNTSISSHSDLHSQRNKVLANSFHTDARNASNMNIQPIDCQQAMPEHYYDHTASYTRPGPFNIQISDQELQSLPIQKDGHMLQTSSGSCVPHNMHGNPIPTGPEVTQYQSHPGVYMNPYNSMQPVAKKSPEIATTPQIPTPSNSSPYTTGSQNIIPTDTTSVMMHGNQPVAVPPPGFHSHSLPEQWAVTHPEMMYFGNMINPMHQYSMPVQNARPVCQSDYNALQQGGYMQPSLFYMPPLCLQGWNPLMQCPGALLQNPQYAGYNPLPQQLLLSNQSMLEPISCPVSTTAQNTSYKNFATAEGQNRKSLSPQKVDTCGGSPQGVNKTGNTKVKDNTLDAQVRASQYYKTPNEFQNWSQGSQPISPYTYTAPIVSPMKTCQSNMHLPMYQKYPINRNPPNVNYQKVMDPSGYNPRDYGRKDDNLKNEECIPPMVSPRECMFYGINYQRKNDYLPSPTLKSEMKH